MNAKNIDQSARPATTTPPEKEISNGNRKRSLSRILLALALSLLSRLLHLRQIKNRPQRLPFRIDRLKYTFIRDYHIAFTSTTATADHANRSSKLPYEKHPKLSQRHQAFLAPLHPYRLWCQRRTSLSALYQMAELQSRYHQPKYTSAHCWMASSAFQLCHLQT